jgi:hypothetical protein
MTRGEFHCQVERRLLARGQSFDAAVLERFADAVYLVPHEDPDIEHWVELFLMLQSRGVAQPWGWAPSVAAGQWDHSDDPEPMFENLQSPSDRKVRLLLAACARRIWGAFSDDRYRAAVEVAERFVEGEVDEAQLSAASGAVFEAFRESHAAGRQNPYEITAALAPAGRRIDKARVVRAMTGAREVAARAAGVEYTVRCHRFAKDDPQASRYKLSVLGGWYYPHLTAVEVVEEAAAQAGLLRCVFGNPFRPVSFAPAWRTAAVMPLALAAYKERSLAAGTLDNARLAVLADALEEAGCPNAELLGHLRSGGEHVRGCWTVDTVLGREQGGRS